LETSIVEARVELRYKRNQLPSKDSLGNGTIPNQNISKKLRGPKSKSMAIGEPKGLVPITSLFIVQNWHIGVLMG